MEQDEVMQTLRDVIEETDCYRAWIVSTPHLVELVKRAVEAEREACEALCKWRTGIQQVDAAIETCEAAIRARGNT